MPIAGENLANDPFTLIYLLGLIMERFEDRSNFWGDSGDEFIWQSCKSSSSEILQPAFDLHAQDASPLSPKTRMLLAQDLPVTVALTEWITPDVVKLTADLAQLLSLFAAAPIPWHLVDLAAEQLGWSQQHLDSARWKLCDCQSLQFTTEGFYEIHPTIRQTWQEELNLSGQADRFQPVIVEVVLKYARELPQPLPSHSYSMLGVLIPHLIEVASTMLQFVQDEDLHYIFSILGNFYSEQGLPSLAKNWYERGLLAAQTRLGVNHPAISASLNNLAGFYQAQGEYAKAETLLNWALEVNQKMGEETLDLATSLNNLAGLYKIQGLYNQAESLYLQALEIKLSLLGEAHPTIAVGLNNLAGVYYAQGHYNEAESLYTRAFQIKECLLGEMHPSLIAGLNNLASVHQAQGRYDDAEAMYVRAATLSSQIWGKDHPSTIAISRNLQKVRRLAAMRSSMYAPLQQTLKRILSQNPDRN